MHALAVALAFLPGFQSPAGPLTKPEATQYAQTSSYQDVVDFLNALKAKNPPMRFEWIGNSPGGKAMPLVVCAKNPMITPFQAKLEGKVVAYVQANIHAGEVEGKEAALILLRELANTPNHPLLDKLVLLVNPIYNIDGNDQFGPLGRNRPSQDGPDPVGVRPNGQGFDLNRDCMKAESNEMRAILENIYRKWDPEVIMDLHTTNGTRHGYVLTYSPPLNPTTDPAILKYCRDTLLPKIRREHMAKYKQDLFDYGNVARQGTAQGGGQRWETFGFEPRYVTNYAGIRNRLGILSEAASFQPFKVRIDSTLIFTKMVLDHVARDSRRVISMCREADATMRKLALAEKPAELGIRYEMDQRKPEKVMLEKPNSGDPVPRNKAPKYFEYPVMPIFDRFKTTRTAKFPAAYVFSGEEKDVAELLARHGAIVERLTADTVGGGDHFEIKEAVVSGQAFQGHRLIRLEGTHRSAKAPFKGGSFVVRTGQPLGLLIFHMLEPESVDGAIAWGFFGESFQAGQVAPVVKVYEPFSLPTEVVR